MSEMRLSCPVIYGYLLMHRLSEMHPKHVTWRCMRTKASYLGYLYVMGILFQGITIFEQNKTKNPQNWFYHFIFFSY
jgi:hypothetical protein